MAHTIYLIREREFIKTNENVYKIGKTTQDGIKRISSYPKGSQVIIVVKVPDCHESELKLISLFKQKFKHRNDIGNEYFDGDCEQMKSFIFDESQINNNHLINNKLLENIIDDKVLKPRLCQCTYNNLQKLKQIIISYVNKYKEDEYIKEVFNEMKTILRQYDEVKPMNLRYNTPLNEISAEFDAFLAEKILNIKIIFEQNKINFNDVTEKKKFDKTVDQLQEEHTKEMKEYYKILCNELLCSVNCNFIVMKKYIDDDKKVKYVGLMLDNEHEKSYYDYLEDMTIDIGEHILMEIQSLGYLISKNDFDNIGNLFLEKIYLSKLNKKNKGQPFYVREYDKDLCKFRTKELDYNLLILTDKNDKCDMYIINFAEKKYRLLESRDRVVLPQGVSFPKNLSATDDAKFIKLLNEMIIGGLDKFKLFCNSIFAKYDSNNCICYYTPYDSLNEYHIDTLLTDLLYLGGKNCEPYDDHINYNKIKRRISLIKGYRDIEKYPNINMSNIKFECNYLICNSKIDTITYNKTFFKNKHMVNIEDDFTKCIGSFIKWIMS